MGFQGIVPGRSPIRVDLLPTPKPARLTAPVGPMAASLLMTGGHGISPPAGIFSGRWLHPIPRLPS